MECKDCIYGSTPITFPVMLMEHELHRFFHCFFYQGSKFVTGSWFVVQGWTAHYGELTWSRDGEFHDSYLMQKDNLIPWSLRQTLVDFSFVCPVSPQISDLSSISLFPFLIKFSTVHFQVHAVMSKRKFTFQWNTNILSARDASEKCYGMCFT